MGTVTATLHHHARWNTAGRMKTAGSMSAIHKWNPVTHLGTTCWNESVMRTRMRDNMIPAKNIPVSLICGLRRFARSGGRREDSRSALWPRRRRRWPGNGFEPATSPSWPPHSVFKTNYLLVCCFSFFSSTTSDGLGLKTEQRLWGSGDPRGSCERANWRDNQGEVSIAVPSKTFWSSLGGILGKKSAVRAVVQVRIRLIWFQN